MLYFFFANTFGAGGCAAAGTAGGTGGRLGREMLIDLLLVLESSESQEEFSESLSVSHSPSSLSVETGAADKAAGWHWGTGLSSGV